ncbi:MAG: hypothetical protein WD768_18720 [Phycisphaeraceae bacterium]
MTEGNVNQPGTPADSAAKANRAGRRRLIKAALLAAPLIVTLRGKPANAQESSLGSIETPDGPILYGPGAYVEQKDIQKSKTDNPSDTSKQLSDTDLGKAIKKKSDGTFEILNDQHRRDQDGSGKTFNRPTGP